MVKTASLYDNFCKTGNYVIYDVIIWVQDGNCKKMARENLGLDFAHSAKNVVKTTANTQWNTVVKEYQQVAETGNTNTTVLTSPVNESCN